MLTSPSTNFKTVSTDFCQDSGRSESLVGLTMLYNRVAVFLNILAELSKVDGIGAYRLREYTGIRWKESSFALLLLSTTSRGVFTCYLD